MASKAIKLLKMPRIWLLIIFIALALFSIPSFKPKGIEVSYISDDSPFYGRLTEGTIISAVNNIPTKTFEDYQKAVSFIKPFEIVAIEAGGQTYRQVAKGDASNTSAYLGINIKKTSPTKISLGLDLQGGARVILKPVPAPNIALNATTLDMTTSVLIARLNAYGLKNMVVRNIKDSSGEEYINVEMAGEGSEKVVDLVKSVGKFELKISNQTVLTGDAIVPPIGEPRINTQTGSWQVPFAINPKAASELRVAYMKYAPTSPQTCSKSEDCNASFACSYGIASSGICLPRIEMFLDDKKMFSAPPAQSLHQTWVFGEDSKDLVVESPREEDAKKVKIVLEAGRLPSQIESLEIVSEDYIDPKLGKDFLKGAGIAGLGALLAVAAIITIRYRRIKIIIPILFTGICELLIVLGVAGLIKWSIDLPAIAGLIVVIGTGVEQQIIITDEVLREGTAVWSLKKGVKKAYGIIIAAASTTIAAMLPLTYPGFTGLYALRGFAIITILGVLIGTLITRPAYANIIETLLEEEE